MNETNDNGTINESDAIRCSLCGENSVTTTIVDHSFLYGSGDEAATLTVKVPVRTCSSCGAEFLDTESEEIKHDAVCRHLGVLTPRQIQRLRKLHDLSRADFARLTKLGEATLGRWERGSLVQNSAYDQYLYLLGFNDNVSRLRDRAGSATPQFSSGFAPKKETQLRVLVITEDVMRRADQFSLSGCRAIACTL